MNAGSKQFVLYNYFRSSTSYRVRIALNYKGIDYEYKPVHLLNEGGEQNKTEYRKLNAMGEVPTLVHNGEAVAQSLAIFHYLDSVHPEKPLFWGSAIQRAQIWQACENINAGVHPICNLKVTQYLEAKLQLDEQKKIQWIHHWVHSGLLAFQKLITKTKKDFCFGDQVSAADMVLIPQLFSARRFQVLLDDFPLLLEVEKKCLQLPAFAKAHPHSQPDTPTESRNQKN